MIRLASIALTSVLGVAGLASTVPAQAGPAVVVEVPGPVYAGGPYAYAHGPYFAPYAGYWHRDFGRDYYYRHGTGITTIIGIVANREFCNGATRR